MAKFTDKQVLELFRDDLFRRLKSDEEYLSTCDSSEFAEFAKSRISLLKDLLRCLDFYSRYEF